MEEKHIWVDTEKQDIQICIKCGEERSIARKKTGQNISTNCTNSVYKNIRPEILTFNYQN